MLVNTFNPFDNLLLSSLIAAEEIKQVFEEADA